MTDLIRLEVSGIDGVLETLKSLPAEVVSKRGGPVKLALAKGARLLRDAAKDNLARAIEQDGSDSTGTLLNSLVARRGKYDGKGELYYVGIKRKVKYRNAHNAETTAMRAGALLEYGGKKQAATPWLVPAARANAQKIIDTVSADLVRRVNLIVKKQGAK